MSLLQNVLSLWDIYTLTPIWNWPVLHVEEFLLTTEAESPSSVTWYIMTLNIDFPSVRTRFLAWFWSDLCYPVVCTIHGILQTRILEWVAFPSPGNLPNPGIKPRSPSLQADSLPAEPPGKPHYVLHYK